MTLFKDINKGFKLIFVTILVIPATIQRSVSQQLPNKKSRKMLDAYFPPPSDIENLDRIALTTEMTQILTGEGNFESYLHCIGKLNSSSCRLYNLEDEIHQHIIESCPSTSDKRAFAEFKTNIASLNAVNPSNICLFIEPFLVPKIVNRRSQAITLNY